MKNCKLEYTAIHRFGIWLIPVFLFSAWCLPVDLLKADGPDNTAGKSPFWSEPVFPPQNQHVHSSSIVELPNGDLLCCWFEGSGERSANDVMIKGARLKKDRHQWSETFVVADTPNNPDCNPLLFLDNKNRGQPAWKQNSAQRSAK